MNKRILELADKAGRYRSHNGGINGGPNPALLHGDENIQKFAHLIVQRCLDRIELEASQYHDPVWALELVQDIREDFGFVDEF